MSDVASNVASDRRPRGRPGYDRETVLRRAVDVFNRRGYDATSVGDLASELGVSKSAIYHHFDSKEALLSSALEEALDGIGRAVARAADDSAATSAYERLRATVEAAVRILVEQLPAVTLLLRVRGNSEIERSALARRRRIDDELAALVRAAVVEGTLRDDVNPDVISRLMFGTVNSVADWYRPDGPLDADTLARTVTTVLFDGLHRER
jgi:AcrR family transcriptional regulator